MKKFITLVIDDTSTMRQFIRHGLEENLPNVHIDEASTGKEAIAKLDQTEYDLVLCDWELPDINGDEILQWVRSHPIIHQTPFIIISSRRDKESVIKAIHGGVNSYMVKPFNVGSLIQKITAVLDGFDRRRFQRFEASGAIILKFNNNILEGTIIDVSLGGVFCISKRNNPLPSIFEKVSIDIKFDSGELSGIDGFTIRLQAAEALINAENVKIAVKFTEFDYHRNQELQKLLDSLKIQE